MSTEHRPLATRRFMGATYQSGHSFRRSVVRLVARILRVPVHFGRIVHGDDE